MSNNQDKINLLLEKLDTLLNRQISFSKEINDLRKEIEDLNIVASEEITNTEEIKLSIPESDTDTEIENIKAEIESIGSLSNEKEEITDQIIKKEKKEKKRKANINLEKFIGENLINKIGIIITIIGVAIGAKYSIEHDLISPLTRIILGYLSGMALLGFGIKLKQNYENYSAVLVSGAIAILYFITYAAYSFYGLIPQSIAFTLMAVFTAFSVFAAINYNRQVIAHIGLVGAYAIPFLLSENSGNVKFLFTYMAIINIGILVIAFLKYWKALFYSSFIITWLMYLSWFGSGYQDAKHFSIAFFFVTAFFVIFYITFLVYKLIRKEKFGIENIILLIINSFIFYGIGYVLLDQHQNYSELLGLFTVVNALIHFIVSVIIYKQKLADKNLFYLVSGLVLVFITIAIPVQLNGNWVTLLWAGEAALLFWIGRTKNIPVYEIISYPLIFLAFCSIIQDWDHNYDIYRLETMHKITPVLNINFLSSILFIAAFSFINIINNNKNYSFPLKINERIKKLISFSIPAILLFSIYYAFRIEIESYYNQLFAYSVISGDSQNGISHNYRNYDLKKFKTIWVINYTLLFVSAIAVYNIRKLKSNRFAIINLILIVGTILIFLTQGLYELSELRENYLNPNLNKYYERSVFNIILRYISFAFIAFIFVICNKYIKQSFIKRNFKLAFEFLLYASVLWILSSELLHWMDIAGTRESYKLGLSIFWGVYSLIVIIIGIIKNKKYLRIGAIALFAITLIKLFAYDISHLNTISKTIVFVSLGILLLIISFLYNKYRNIISDKDEI